MWLALSCRRMLWHFRLQVCAWQASTRFHVRGFGCFHVRYCVTEIVEGTPGKKQESHLMTHVINEVEAELSAEDPAANPSFGDTITGAGLRCISANILLL